MVLELGLVLGLVRTEILKSLLISKDTLTLKIRTIGADLSQISVQILSVNGPDPQCDM